MTGEFKAGLLGWPVSHSLSPLIHSFFIEHFKMEGSYGLYPVKPEKLSELVRELRHRKFTGLNVTVPHKISAMKLCDTLSTQARFAGAVNTLVFESTGLKGYNTDVAGFKALVHGLPSPFYVLGRGGAAAAVSLALTGMQTIFLGRGDSVPDTNLPGMATVVNATPLGWNDSDIFPFDIPDGWSFVDLNYNPRWNWRNQLVVPVVTGEKMLVEQAAESFRLWTGLAPDENQKTMVLKRIRKELYENKDKQ